MMYKVDLHTHSVGSPDGGLSVHHYEAMLERGGLDAIAITDHNSIEFAQQLQGKLGERIIIGEEITTTDGEVIGLFLKHVIPEGLSLEQTVRAIRRQHGLVYVPHPFETVRHGLSLPALDSIAEQVDIIETHNGRAVFQNKSAAVRRWATTHHVPGAASSDAHGWHGWGRAYNEIAELPGRDNLVSLLAHAHHTTATVGWRGVLYPKLNRLRKRRAGQ